MGQQRGITTVIHMRIAAIRSSCSHRLLCAPPKRPEASRPCIEDHRSASQSDAWSGVVLSTEKVARARPAPERSMQKHVEGDGPVLAVLSTLTVFKNTSRSHAHDTCTACNWRLPHALTIAAHVAEMP